MAFNDTYAGNFNFYNNAWTSTTSSTIQVWPGTAIEPDTERLLTDMEWLDAAVDEIRELAFAA